MVKRVAILGAGNGGCAFAGHLATRGFEVGLYEDAKFKKNIDEVREKGGVELIGAVQGLGKFSNASTNVKDVVPGADVVMVVVPAFAQSVVMEAALPYLEDGQIVVFNPDNFGSLVLRKMMRDKGVERDIKTAGTASLMYATRRIAPAKVNIWAVKEIMPIAALPATDTEHVVNSVRDMFPQFTPAANVLEIGIGNPNMVVHCATAVLNAGRIEDTKGDFMFYWQGMTESVCRVLDRVDEERLAVAEGLGLKLMSDLEFLRQVYPSQGKGVDLHDFLTHSSVHGGHGPDAPKDLHYRYIDEDVPYGLVPVSSFGKTLGVSTPVIDSVITLASALNATDYFKAGRTLETLGLAGRSREEILEFVERGGK